MTKIFSPQKGQKMKVGVFFSGGASAFNSMLDDPKYGYCPAFQQIRVEQKQKASSNAFKY